MEKIYFDGADGLKLAADAGGPRDGPIVVLLHGGGQTRQSWGSTAKTLSEAGYYVIALDARGHGESGWAPNGHYTLDGFVNDLRAVLAQLPDTPALIGASLGGLTAMCAVGEASTQIARILVLVDIAPKMNREGTARVHQFMSGGLEGFETLEDVAEAVAAYLPQRKRLPNIEGLRRNLRVDGTGRFHWHWDPAFVRPADPKASDWPIEERTGSAARNIRIPTLLVRGALSDVVDEEAVAHFRALMPNAGYVKVSGAGHMIAGDSNAAFNDEILGFLRHNLPR
jgi:pimeloyl-ACP methyl ester carboxylesterase